MTERRHHRRVPTVLQATWHGLSGDQPCRVTDISWGGCFVQALASPRIDHAASITVTLGGADVGFRGRVRYVEPLMGFAIQFERLTGVEIEALRAVLGDPSVSVRGSVTQMATVPPLGARA